MWWECSDCGGHVERDRRPALCRECGTAGVIFVAAEVDNAIAGVPEADGLRDVWLRAGIERGEPIAAWAT
jgi:predicted amidophosphoribosyltransferase